MTNMSLRGLFRKKTRFFAGQPKVLGKLPKANQDGQTKAVPGDTFRSAVSDMKQKSLQSNFRSGVHELEKVATRLTKKDGGSNDLNSQPRVVDTKADIYGGVPSWATPEKPTSVAGDEFIVAEGADTVLREVSLKRTGFASAEKSYVQTREFRLNSNTGVLTIMETERYPDELRNATKVKEQTSTRVYDMRTQEFLGASFSGDKEYKVDANGQLGAIIQDGYTS